MIGLLFVFHLVQQTPRSFDAKGRFLPLDTKAAVPTRLRSACPKEQWDDRDALLRSDDSLAKIALGGSTSTTELTQLGCARAALMLNGAVGHPGYGMQTGTSWAHGAVEVLEEALRAAPQNAQAAKVLTLVGLWAADPKLPAERIWGERSNRDEPLAPIANVLFSAVRHGLKDSSVFRGCTSYLLDVGDFASARECSSRALEAGADSTWHLLRLAYIAAHYRDTLLMMCRFGDAVAAANDTDALRELGWQLDFHQLPGIPVRYLGDSLHPAQRRQWLTILTAKPRETWVDSLLHSLSRRSGEPPRTILFNQFWSVTYGLGSFHNCVATLTPFASSSAPGTVSMDEIDEPCFPREPPDLYDLGLTASLYRLWGGGSEQPAAVLTYSAPLDKLLSIDTLGRHVVPLTVSVRQDAAASGVWTDTTIAKEFVLPPGTDRGILRGMAVLPASPDVTEWHLVASQSENRRGIVTEQGLAPLGTGPLALSDIVLGAPDQQMAWTPPGDSVWLLPLGAADHDKPVAFFVQIRSDTARNARFALAVFRVDHGVPDPKPALQIIDQITLSKGFNPTHRLLGASRLKAGSYEFRLTVTDATTGLSAERRTDLILR